jgi:hypothetical protein
MQSLCNRPGRGVCVLLEAALGKPRTDVHHILYGDSLPLDPLLHLLREEEWYARSLVRYGLFYRDRTRLYELRI